MNIISQNSNEEIIISSNCDENQINDKNRTINIDSLISHDDYRLYISLVIN